MALATQTVQIPPILAPASVQLLRRWPSHCSFPVGLLARGLTKSDASNKTARHVGPLFWGTAVASAVWWLSRSGKKQIVHVPHPDKVHPRPEDAVPELPESLDDPAVLPQILSQALGNSSPFIAQFAGRAAIVPYGTPADDKVAIVPHGTPDTPPSFKLTLEDFPAACRGTSVTKVLSDSACRHAFEEDIAKHLAKAHGVHSSRIKINSIEKGSVVVNYSIFGAAAAEMRGWIDGCERIAKSLMETLEHVAVNLVVVLPSLGFDIRNFDSAGDKKNFEGQDFNTEGEIYHEPKPGKGWKRVGVCVLGKYDSDTWLAPFGHEGTGINQRSSDLHRGIHSKHWG